MKPQILKLNFLLWMDTDSSLPDQKDKNEMEGKMHNQQYTRLDLVSIYRIRKEIKSRLRENDQKIAFIKTSMEEERNESYSNFMKILFKLNQQNAMLKIKIYEYIEETMAKWESFIVSYLLELDEICNSINELAEKNLKRS